MNKAAPKAGAGNRHAYRPGRPAAGERTVAALRKARALETVSAVERGAPRPLSPFQQVLYLVLGTAGIIAGTLAFLLCAGFLVASILIGSVLDDIAKRDFSAPIERINHYEVFFESVAKAGYAVNRDKPKILEGVTTYLWTVQPRGTDELRVFEWQHDLSNSDQELALVPKTSAAVYADIKLGYLKPQDATSFPFYEPDDKLCLAIVNTDFTLFQTPEGGSGWLALDPLPEGPVLPPKVTPEEGKKRAYGGSGEEQTATEEPAPAADGQQDSDAVEVNTGEGQSPGEGGNEPPVEVGGGDGGDGGQGGETPPDDGGNAGDGGDGEKDHRDPPSGAD